VSESRIHPDAERASSTRLLRERIARSTGSLICLIAFLCTPTHAEQALVAKDAKRECATCHLDWVETFDRPGALLLIDRPTKPQSAEEPMCLGCHDGSVGDSRRGVWLEHGHRLNEKPSEKVQVPAKMPLDDAGRMVCKTCHTAHTVPGVNDISKVVFLRSARDGGLCQQCHVDRAYGAEHGSHPLAKLPFELPKPITDAHGRTDMADRTKMACQTCHAAHGAQRDHLLVMSTESGQLCKSCHEQLRPDAWHADAPREHPQNAQLKTPRQKQAIADMGTRLGPGDTLTCFTCHKMHDGKSGKFMLADSLNDSALCMRCHEEKRVVLESKHDLRKTRPDEVNKLGLKPDESGACGSCHSFHGYAREIKPSLGDPVGVCTSCHQPKDQVDAAVASATGPAVNFAHPSSLDTAKLPKTTGLKISERGTEPGKTSLNCYTCHDPHDSSKKLFLRKGRDDLCATCHTDRFASMAGKHDFIDRPELKNARGESAKDSGKCGFCHAVHGDTDLALWAATKDKPKGPDDLCLQCHRQDGLAHDKPAFAFNHPTGPTARKTAQTGGLPLFNEHARVDKAGFVSCASCHDPHANSTSQKQMLRVGGPVSTLCTTCHADHANMAKGPHDSAGKTNWPVKSGQSDLCTTCHTPHSNDPERQRFTFAPATGFARSDGTCVACHEKSAWAPNAKQVGDDDQEKIPIGRAMHPTTLPKAGHAGTAKSALPLLASKPGGPADSIGCRTCHNPHANARATPYLTRTAPGQPAQALCTQCHTEAAPLPGSMHAADALAQHAASFVERGLKSPADAKAQACAPCHSTHALEGSQKPFLWAAKSSTRSASEADNRCLSCHESPSAESSRVLLVKHPEEPLRARKWATTGPAKYSSPDDDPSQIHCATCHITHGDPQTAADLETADLNTRRAARPMLRKGVSEQCAQCHGIDASRNFLYWHDPAKRRTARGLIQKQD
jgi:predicted CXXCH cytochrome family protein